MIRPGDVGDNGVRRRLARVWFSVVTLCFALSGCGGSASPAMPPTRSTASVTAVATRSSVEPSGASSTPTAMPIAESVTRAELAAGMALFQAQCEGCHSMFSAGISGPSQPVGPDLDGIGRSRQPGWLLEQMVDPCSHAPKGSAGCSRMPSFAGLTQQQLTQIVAFLSSSR